VLNNIKILSISNDEIGVDMKTTFRSKAGFTLIEVMVVVIIIGILAVAIVPNLTGKTEEARKAQAKSDIRALENALDEYASHNSNYPSTEQGLQALIEKPTGEPEALDWKGPYIKRLSRDPWKNHYQYQNPGTHGNYDVFSMGKDKNSPDDDIGNWNLE
jgi:general secretion pathway protein G